MVGPRTLATSESFRSILHSSLFHCVISFFLSSVCFCVSCCATCVRVDIVSTQPEPPAVQALGKTLESSQNTSDILGDMEVRVLSRLARWPCAVQPASPHAAQRVTALHNTVTTLCSWSTRCTTSRHAVQLVYTLHSQSPRCSFQGRMHVCRRSHNMLFSRVTRVVMCCFVACASWCAQ
jgi:hypothetical protein